MTKLNDKEIEKLFKSIDDEICYAVVDNEFHVALYYYKNKPRYLYVDNDYMIDFGGVQYNQDYYYIVERPSTHIYTKEFNVRGGSNIEPVFQPCEILFEGDKYIVVRNNDGREFVRRRSRIIIRDIDTRTDEEKAFAVYWDSIEYSIGVDSHKSAMEKAFKAGITWSESKWA